MEGKKGIEYSEVSWNPFSGCENIQNGNCSVGKKCWAYGMSLRLAGRCGYDSENPFQPTFHEDKLDVPLKRMKPTIFNTCFMGDIGFAKKEWMEKIIEVIEQCPQHRFIFLTKAPHLLSELDITFPENCIVGVTVNCQDDYWRIGNLHQIDCKYRWVSFEPLYGKVLANLDGIDWVVIGAQSSPEYQPKKEWVDELIRCADYYNIPVFVKPNLTVVKPKMELPEVLRIGD